MGHRSRPGARPVAKERVADRDREPAAHARAHLRAVARAQHMSLTTPLRQVLGAGPARSGVHHWWLQRLTSLALVPLSIWFVVSLLLLPSLDHFTVVSWLRQSSSALMLVVFVLSGTWHSQLGVRVIIE